MSPGVMSSSELEAALRSLEEVGTKMHHPSHYLARDVLLALGRWMRESEPEGQEALLARARKAGHSLGQGWVEAVQTELSVACAEFVQSVDPRYLGVPGYDLEYTRASRARLEDRLRAATALGFTPVSRETELLAMADRVWTAHLGRPSSRPAEPKPSGPAKGSGQLGRRRSNN